MAAGNWHSRDAGKNFAAHEALHLSSLRRRWRGNPIVTVTGLKAKIVHSYVFKGAALERTHSSSFTNKSLAIPRHQK